MVSKIIDMKKSAIICVASPLQALCAIEAIKHFKIENYRLYVVNDNISLSNIVEVLGEKNPYEVLPFKTKWFLQLYFMMLCLFPSHGDIDYLIMGDFRLFALKFRFLPKLRKNGKIIYVDDGNYLLSLSKGLCQLSLSIKVRRFFFSCVTYVKSINDNNYFTIFYQLINKKGWKLIHNDMDSLSGLVESSEKAVYIIGTASSIYCDTVGISFDRYKTVLLHVMKSLKKQFPHDVIYYIPHRRDDATWIKDACDAIGIKYYKCESCIEIDIIRRNVSPIEIFGFSSTALITLKRMFSKINVTNLYIDGGCNSQGVKEYMSLIDEFIQLGIQTQKI